MRTLQEMIIEHAKKPELPILRFNAYCHYIYDPKKRIEESNLPAAEKRELLEAVEARLGEMKQLFHLERVLEAISDPK